MTAKSDNLMWNEKKQRWEDKNGNIGYGHKKVCEKCNKPRLDINGVIDCDFCLQGPIAGPVDYELLEEMHKPNSILVAYKNGNKYVKINACTISVSWDIHR